MRNGLVLCFVLLLQGCSATIDDYRDETPALVLPEFLNGSLEAYGLVQDRSGKVVRRFYADIRGEWVDGKGVLDEQFRFMDGEVQHRCWRLEKEGNRYTGTAGDVIGRAAGEVAGNTMNWRYTLLVPVGDSSYEIALNDWLHLVDENNLINYATMTKFGLEVGKVTLYMKRLPDKPVRAPLNGCVL